MSVSSSRTLEGHTANVVPFSVKAANTNRRERSDAGFRLAAETCRVYEARILELQTELEAMRERAFRAEGGGRGS